MLRHPMLRHPQLRRHLKIPTSGAFGMAGLQQSPPSRFDRRCGGDGSESSGDVGGIGGGSNGGIGAAGAAAAVGTMRANDARDNHRLLEGQAGANVEEPEEEMVEMW